MPAQQTQEKYSVGEIVERGEAIYQASIKADIEADNVGKYLVVNIENGEWVMGIDHLETLQRARALWPDAGRYRLKVGYPATGAIGTSLRPFPQYDTQAAK